MSSPVYVFTVESFVAPIPILRGMSIYEQDAWWTARKEFEKANTVEIEAAREREVEIAAAYEREHKTHLRVDPRDGRTYYQGDYVLKPWEMKFQAEEGDYMDFELVKNWQAFPMQDYNWERNSTTNDNIYDYLRPLMEEALERNDITTLKPVYLRYWCFPDNVESGLVKAGEVAFAITQFRHDVAAHGKIEAGVRFLAKMVRAHAECVRLGLNWHNTTVRQWVHNGWMALIGPADERDTPRCFAEYDVNGHGIEETEIPLYDDLLETEEDIAELIRRTSQWPVASDVASGLRQAFEYYADQRE